VGLEPGDLIAVPCGAEEWACLLVVAVRREGPGSRTTFHAGVLSWRGAERPTRESTVGAPVSKVALIPIEVFADGGLEVVDSGAFVDKDLIAHTHDFEVGAKHSVWGWRTAIQKAQMESR
jgi:hypothetical protein